MKIHITHGDIHLTDLRTRMPFKYGIATLTSTPHAFVRLVVEVDGKPSAGIAADSLPPKWFTKDPARPLAPEVSEMLEVIEHALRTAVGTRAESPFDAWRQLSDAQAAWGRGRQLPPLLTNFGTSLIERALIEAVCRAAGRPFAEVLRANQLGIRLGELHAGLAGRNPADFLPGRPLPKVIVRHTVGLADPLEEADISAGDRVDDGLPQALTACIHFYGLQHFKIKVSGVPEHDRERLLRVAHAIEKYAERACAFSLDGNEQFHDLPTFQAYWEDLLRNPDLRRFFAHLLFVEQPFHRAVALRPPVVGGMKGWPGRPPLIIDESDAELDSLSQALRLGYAGTSHKNCKGVFKSIANCCLLEQRRREQPSCPAILSGEDLVNIGPVALLQDLAVAASLGIASVERNGHHYFAGLSMFPQEVQEQVVKAHGDLYRPTRKGWPTLRITDGMLPLASVLAAPLGVGWQLRVEPFTTVAAWRQSHGS